ncbi:MAG: hypothetical protein ACFB15_17300 [Cyclobacteriaceae bacterium]
MDSKHVNVKLINDSERQVLKVSLKDFVPDQDFKTIWQTVEDKFAKSTVDALLLDCSDLRVISPTSQTWLVEDWFIRAKHKFDAKLRLAIINAESFFGIAVVKNLSNKLASVAGNSPHEVFQNENEALTWISQ